jgi:uncharacterized membrane protein YbhN (UPF0104 family)
VSRRFAISQAVISLAALAGVIWWGAHQDAPPLPSSADALVWMLGAGALYGAGTLLRAERWHRILERSRGGVRRQDSYSLTTVGYMGNNVLPARAGEMLRVVILAPRSQLGKRALLGTVVAERLLDAVALAAAALAAFFMLRRRGLLGRARDFLRPLAGAPRALASRHGAGLLMLSFAIWAVEATVYLGVAQAAGLDVSPMESLYLVALTNLFAMLPAAPGYVGTFDAAVIFGVKAIGTAGSAAVSYLLLLRFVLFVPITLVGLVVLLVRYGGLSRLRSARLEATQA